jgi:TPR repeat protein
MKRLISVLAGGLMLNMVVLAQPLGKSPAPDNDQMLREQKHFFESLAYVYYPTFWISYNGSLYFAPKTDAQTRQIEALKAARARYVALTNREARHQLVALALAGSGLDKSWQEKMLLPYSDTNPNLTPTLDRPVRSLPSYQVLQALGEGDVLLKGDEGICFVMGFGHGADDGSGTNAVLLREGTKSFSTTNGYKTVEAFASVSLSKEEKAALNRAVVAFQHKAASFAPAVEAKDREDFQACLARASDSNPYMEYLVARDYLEGRGTPKDEKTGLDWMNKAANHGSGDAKKYLDNAPRSAQHDQ